MELASSFNLAAFFKQSISSESTSSVLFLSFNHINFETFTMSVIDVTRQQLQPLCQGSPSRLIKWLVIKYPKTAFTVCCNKVSFNMLIFLEEMIGSKLLLLTITYNNHLYMLHTIYDLFSPWKECVLYTGRFLSSMKE